MFIIELLIWFIVVWLLFLICLFDLMSVGLKFGLVGFVWVCYCLILFVCLDVAGECCDSLVVDFGFDCVRLYFSAK